MNRLIVSSAVLAAAVLLGCSENEVAGPGDPGIVRVEVSPDSLQLTLGRTVHLEATSFDASGPVNRPITWTSTNEAVAVVDGAGRVQTKGLGTAVIRASVGGVSGEARLTVATWDLMFFALSGSVFAETLVLPPFSGGFPERLFPVGRSAMDAAPSPDGKRIAYAVRSIEGYTDLWVAERDGTNARLLVASEGNDEWPSWSPDGTRIAFQSDRSGELNDIYVIDASGSGLRRLTYDPLPAVISQSQPAWSPDGARIAYTANAGGTYDIFTVRPDGTDVRRITNTADSELEPDWAPDGSRLAVRIVTQANEWDVAIVSATGAELRRIALPGWQRAPSWRPDGEVLAFSGRTQLQEPWQVWTVNADGSSAVQQTPDSFTGGHRPTWLRRQ